MTTTAEIVVSDSGACHAEYAHHTGIRLASPATAFLAFWEVHYVCVESLYSNHKRSILQHILRPIGCGALLPIKGYSRQQRGKQAAR